jgi:hypothetical protein
MRKKIILIVISIPVLILLTSLSYTCIKKYCSHVEADKLYRAGLEPKYNKDNVFSPRAELEFYDSLLQKPWY